MITYLKCDDFKEKQYLDELDESYIFVRKEECQHYAINMKRKLNGQNIKFEITVDCKKCQLVTRQDFYKSKGEFIFNCPGCGCCKMNFRYYNSNTDEIQGEEEIHIKLPEEKNKEKDSQAINIGLSQFEEDLVKGGGNKEKIYRTPDNQNENNNHFFEFAPPPASKSLINYKPVNNNNNNDKGKEVSITFFYNEEKYEMKFSNLDSIEKKYDIIQEKCNFQDKKYFYLNGEYLDIKKLFKDYDVVDRIYIEISDIKYDN